MTGARTSTDLASTVDLLTGFPFKSSSYCGPDEGVRLVRGDNVMQRGIRWDGAKHWPSSLTGEFGKYRLMSGDVVLAMDRPWIEAGLKVAEIRAGDAPSLLVQRVARLRTRDPGLRQDYLKWLLYTPAFTQHVLSVQTGTAVPHISGGQILSFKFELPDLDEQRRIAGVLGAFDDLIDTNHGLVGRLEALLAAVFDEEGFDSDSGDGLLGDVISVNPFYRKPTGVAPYVDMAALPTQGARVSAVGSRKAAGGARFTSGDTLLARITPCLENGKTAFVDFLDTDEVGVGSTEFIVLRDQTGVSQHWPYFLARSERFRSYAIRHMTGTSGRQRCPAEAVARYPLAAPEREDLRRFERLAEPLFAAMRQLDAESAELTRTRDEFLPLLMSGRITVDEAWEALP